VSKSQEVRHVGVRYVYFEGRYGVLPESDLDGRISAYSERLKELNISDGFEVINNGQDQALYTAYLKLEDERVGIIAKAMTPVDTPVGRMRKLIVVAVGYEQELTKNTVESFAKGIDMHAEKADRDEISYLAGRPLDDIMLRVSQGE